MLNWINSRYKILGLGFTFLMILNLTLYVLWKAPVKVDNACVFGHNLTLGNAGFAVVISGLLALNVIGVVEIFRNRQIENKASLSTLGIGGFILWIISTVCFACYIPIISVLGFNLGLNFLNIFEGWAQFVGIFFAILGVYMVDRQIREGCRDGKCDI
jgi:hypothetical protein